MMAELLECYLEVAPDEFDGDVEALFVQTFAGSPAAACRLAKEVFTASTVKDYGEVEIQNANGGGESDRRTVRRFHVAALVGPAK